MGSLSIPDKGFAGPSLEPPILTASFLNSSNIDIDIQDDRGSCEGFPSKRPTQPIIMPSPSCSSTTGIIIHSINEVSNVLKYKNY